MGLRLGAATVETQAKTMNLVSRVDYSSVEHQSGVRSGKPDPDRKHNRKHNGKETDGAQQDGWGLSPPSAALASYIR